MPARSIWSGSISFGLVSIPVRLAGAIKHREVLFSQVHATDGARIYEKRFCSKDDREVAWDQIARGFALNSRKTVIITPQELEAANPQVSRVIPIEGFLKKDAIDPLYFLHSYYLIPETAGKIAYSVLQRIMEQTERAALGKIILRQRQYYCLLRPYRGAILLSTLLYPDEIVLPKAAGVSGLSAATSGQLKLARQIVAAMQQSFQPGRLKDTHRDKVLALLKKKARGQTLPHVKVRVEKPTRVAELLKQLEKSREVAKFAASRRR